MFSRWEITRLGLGRIRYYQGKKFVTLIYVIFYRHADCKAINLVVFGSQEGFPRF